MKQFLAALLLSSALFGESIVVNNRPLAVANNRMISVIDVQKKMDIFAFENKIKFNNKRELYQYYMGNWKYSLDQMIDAEYMMLRAEKRKMIVPDGEVREEMMSRFGPNILATLEEMDVEYEDAWDMLRKEMTCARVLWQGVQAKVMQRVTPEAIKHAYYAYVATHPPKEEWDYQFVTLRGAEKDELEDIGQTAHSLLATAKTSLEGLPDALAEEGCSVSISKPMKVDFKNMSEQHKSILATLKEGEYSTPISQLSRASNETVTRVFKLNSVTKETVPTFNDMHTKLKNAMLQEYANKENIVYSKQLRETYDFIDTPLPDNFQPFLMSNV